MFFGIQVVLQKDKFSFPVNISAYIDSYLWQIRILFGALIALVLGVFNTSTLTLFSREGKYAWIHRVLPIQPKDELMGRVFYGCLINLPIVILAMVAYQVFVQIDLYLILFSIPGAMMMLFPQITLPLAVDAKFPHLHWEDPSKMQAGNFQFILAGIGNFILTLVIGVLLFYFVHLIYSSIKCLFCNSYHPRTRVFVTKSEHFLVH